MVLPDHSFPSPDCPAMVKVWVKSGKRLCSCDIWCKNGKNMCDGSSWNTNQGDPNSVITWTTGFSPIFPEVFRIEEDDKWIVVPPLYIANETKKIWWRKEGRLSSYNVLCVMDTNVLVDCSNFLVGNLSTIV